MSPCGIRKRLTDDGLYGDANARAFPPRRARAGYGLERLQRARFWLGCAGAITAGLTQRIKNLSQSDTDKQEHSPNHPSYRRGIQSTSK